jgi:protein SCO1/2
MTRRVRCAILFSLLLWSPSLRTGAEDGMDHSQHHKAMKDKTLKRSTGTYQVPNLSLINQDAEKVQLRTLLDSDKPVSLNFIFATCTTICPVLSAGFAEFRHRLGEDADEVQFVSISIDPEHDTAEVLKAYSKRFGGDKGWTFLTGTRADIDQAMKAFGVYVSNKMEHRPVTFMRASKNESWVRIDGLMGGGDYAAEYARLTGADASP